MFIVITNNNPYCLPLPWQQEYLCRGYRRETVVFSPGEFIKFLESLNGDYSLIKGLTILTPLEGGYKFIENCNFLQQLYIFDSIAKINIKLSNLVLLRQMVIHCREFYDANTLLDLIANKMNLFEKDDNYKYIIGAIYIKNIEINANQIDIIRTSPVFRGELILNNIICDGVELNRRRERQEYIEKNKNRENRYSRSESIKSLKKLFGDES